MTEIDSTNSGPDAPAPLERRNNEGREALRAQVATVLATSAGLTITAPQVAVLCGLRRDVGQRIAVELVGSGVLSPLEPAQGPGGDRWRPSGEAFGVRR